MSDPKPPPVVELVDAAVSPTESLHQFALIQNVNWKIDYGDFWAVAGLPGSGKTDLLATAAGLQKPLKGEQYLFGKNTKHMDEFELVEKRLKIGVVFANGRLFTQLTVRDNVALPICYHRNCSAEEAAAEVEAALKLTELQDLADRRPADVTRNIHPRIGLARALALNPEALLVDNPLMAVDPREAYWWRDFLSAVAKGHDLLQGKKITVVVSADDFRPWMNKASCFALIKDKAFVKVGDPEELRSHEDPLVREFIVTRGWT